MEVTAVMEELAAVGAMLMIMELREVLAATVDLLMAGPEALVGTADLQ
jgi:hypothetical protein